MAVTWTDPVTTDNSGQNVTLTSSLASGSELGPGDYSVTITATDVMGNQADCCFNVVVEGSLKWMLAKLLAQAFYMVATIEKQTTSAYVLRHVQRERERERERERDRDRDRQTDRQTDRHRNTDAHTHIHIHTDRHRHTEIHIHTERHKHAHTHTYRQTDRQTHTQTHKQADRQTDRQTHILTVLFPVLFECTMAAVPVRGGLAMTYTPLL